jgi:hypothetical protein
MAPVSWGELIDKFTILSIKTERLPDPAQGSNVRRELDALLPLRDRALRLHPDLGDREAELKQVNEGLWEVEDAIRDCERRKDFGPHFIELARAVYHENDRRSAIKRQINQLLGSALVEEKSYQPY